MRCTPIVTGLVLSFATVSTQAQVSIDVSKITCDEYVHDKIRVDLPAFTTNVPLETRSMLSRSLIAAWLSGYYHAKRNNKIIDLDTFEDKASKLTNYCYDEKNFKVPIMEAIERIVGK